MMTRHDWRIPGPPSQALREFLKRDLRRPASLTKLEEAFASDPTEENFDKLKAERERLWIKEERNGASA